MQRRTFVQLALAALPLSVVAQAPTVTSGTKTFQVAAGFHLNPGYCVLGPREIPHAWAFAGGSPGKLLISFAPAGKMEAFFNEREIAA